MLRTLLLITIAISVSACSTLNREECMSADWELIGFNDGQAGRTTDRLEQHREACAEYAIAPVLEDYLAGHHQGARRYCIAENGYQRARAGKAFNPVCKGELKSDFAYGFSLGQEARQQLLRVNKEEHKLSRLNKQLNEVELKISDYEQALIEDGKTREQRYELLQKLEIQQDRQLELESKIRRQTGKLAMEQRYLEDLERDLRQQL